ncbi:MAG: hypothetical protein VKK04_25100 [Synechococcales bacterium]|nr:hypothetical protein [Synechococcales bacterium]
MRLLSQIFLRCWAIATFIAGGDRHSFTITPKDLTIQALDL